jgi:hypothetical protein
MMYKIRGGGPGVHFNVGLSGADKAELDSISLEALMETHKKPFSTGSSLYRGVSWNNRDKRWIAQSQFRGMNRHLGCFLLEEDAAHAYDRAAKEICGRYVSICFII